MLRRGMFTVRLNIIHWLDSYIYLFHAFKERVQGNRFATGGTPSDQPTYSTQWPSEWKVVFRNREKRERPTDCSSSKTNSGARNPPERVSRGGLPPLDTLSHFFLSLWKWKFLVNLSNKMHWLEQRKLFVYFCMTFTDYPSSLRLDTVIIGFRIFASEPPSEHKRTKGGFATFSAWNHQMADPSG
jgi:hypothetical protein